MEDVNAILRVTEASDLFGHSAGGFFALEAALRLPVLRLALYEPAVSIHGSLPLDWFPAYEKALAHKDPALAMVHLVKGLHLNWMSQLPDWLLLPFARLMLRGDDGQEVADLLPSGVWEIKLFQRCDESGLNFERYRAIKARTLLLGGTKSPVYLKHALRELTAILPQARLIELDGLDHNAPDQNAPQKVALELKAFFS